MLLSKELAGKQYMEKPRSGEKDRKLWRANTISKKKDKAFAAG
jgi:hypothetical protein